MNKINMAKTLIEQDIKWHEEHREQVTPEQGDWFIKGMKQALDLVVHVVQDDSCGGG